MTRPDPSPLTAHERGTLVRVLVVPGASRTEVVGRHGDAVRIRLAAPAEGGKANQALVRLLSALCDASVTRVRGGSSRRKIVLIEGRDPVEVESCLGLTRAN